MYLLIIYPLAPSGWSRAHAPLISVWFIHSATPFCCGVPGAVVSQVMPCSSRKWVKSSDMNSPPQSKRKNLIFRPVNFLIIAVMCSKLGEGSSGVGDHQRSPEKDGRSGFEYGTSCAVVWFFQRSQARVRRARRLGALGVGDTGGEGAFTQWV